MPGLFVEHDDEFLGACYDDPTPCAAHEGPMDEDRALKMAREMMSSRGSKSPGDEKASSDKENDLEATKKKKGGGKQHHQQQQQMKQKVLSAKNGTLATSVNAAAAAAAEAPSTSNGPMVNGGTAEDVKAVVKREPTATSDLPWGACLGAGNREGCSVHSSILPKTTWSYFSTIEEVDEVIERLNPRGIREAELADKLTFERDGIARNLRKFPKMGDRLCRKLAEEKEEKAEAKEEPMDVDGDGGEGGDKKKPLAASGSSSSSSSSSSLSSAMDLTLRDQILEMEEKIYLGSLGTLKVRDRAPWRSAIQYGGYDRQTDGLAWGGRTSAVDTPFESRLQSVGASREGSPERARESGSKRDSTGSNPSNATAELRRVKDLASAILQIGQMVDAKFFKPPLGEGEKEKKKRLKEEEKRKKEREAAAEAAEDGDGEEPSRAEQPPPPPALLTPLQEWENSLMGNTSYAQLFVHLTTLESSVSWSKSLLNTKCRICRRKTDPENMLICDGCDRGYHMYCLKPKLKAVPKGDWFCYDCKPKERVRSPKKKSRRVFSSAEDDEEVENQARKVTF